MKWLKFGFTRSFDNLSLEIRSGRLTRDAALGWLAARGDETPRADISAFCTWLGVSEADFFAAAESFRDPGVWRHADGVWKIPGFLIPEWQWQ
jgi:hypothetical protein